MMQKPASIIREEVISSIANTINNSGLPAFVIAPILQDFLEQSKVIMKKQYEKDMEDYAKSIKTNTDIQDGSGLND